MITRQIPLNWPQEVLIRSLPTIAKRLSESLGPFPWQLSAFLHGAGTIDLPSQSQSPFLLVTQAAYHLLIEIFTANMQNLQFLQLCKL